MASQRRFWKVVYKCEVLVENEDMANAMEQGMLRMDEVAAEIDYGGSSGSFGVESFEEVDGPKMAELLLEQGSDPEFFGLDEEGNDCDDDDVEDEDIIDMMEEGHGG